MELPQVTSFRQLMAVELEEFLSSCRGFGQPLSGLANIVYRAFEVECIYITNALRSARPEDMGAEDQFGNLMLIIQEIQEYRDRNRASEQFFNHLATVAESVVALNWIRIPNTPVPFIRDMIEAGDYFGNRVLSANRGNQQHTTWVNNWRVLMRALEDYVRQYFRTGLTFGIAAPHRRAGAAPGVPPPPPPPPSASALLRPDPMAGGDNREALLNELNQGVNITQMLRPVRAEGVLPRRQPAAGPAQFGPTGDEGGLPGRQPAAGPAQFGPTGDGSRRSQPAARIIPPKFILEGRKWRVEHQKNNLGMTLHPNSMNESLAMFKCENAALEVTDKMTGVTIDNCKRTTVIVKDVIASVELIRCEYVQLKCLGNVSTITLDSCDSVQVFLSEDARRAEHILSKCTSTNICLLQPDGEYVEHPVPEQIRTIVVDGRLQSSVVTIN